MSKVKWFRHEALHTTNNHLLQIEETLVNHHYFDSEINPEFNKQINKAIKALAKAYQAVGSGRELEVKRKIKL